MEFDEDELNEEFFAELDAAERAAATVRAVAGAAAAAAAAGAGAGGAGIVAGAAGAVPAGDATRLLQRFDDEDLPGLERESATRVDAPPPAARAAVAAAGAAAGGGGAGGGGGGGAARAFGASARTAGTPISSEAGNKVS